MKKYKKDQNFKKTDSNKTNIYNDVKIGEGVEYYTQNKLKNLLIAFGILIVIFLLVVFIIEFKEKNTNNGVLSVSNLINNNDTKDANQAAESLYYTVQNISEETSDYDINIFYPMTKSEVLNKYISSKINAYIKDIKYISESSSEIKDAHKYTLNMSFNMYEGNNNTISFAFWVIYDNNYLHVNRSIFTVIYDTKKDKIIKIEDLINEYENFIVNLSNYCYDNLKENERIKALGAYDILEAGTKANKYNFSDMVISKDEIIVMFETYQVAPYVAGEFEVNVPLSYLKR